MHNGYSHERIIKEISEIVKDHKLMESLVVYVIGLLFCVKVSKTIHNEPDFLIHPSVGGAELVWDCNKRDVGGCGGTHL